MVSTVPPSVSTVVKAFPSTKPSKITQQLPGELMKISADLELAGISTTDPSVTLIPLTVKSLNMPSLGAALAGLTARPDSDVITTAKIVSSEMRLDLNT
jgi:hypothetical protein